jgi:hypothetical protein
MAVADLLRDKTLVPDKPAGELRDLAKDFILRRVRALLDLNPGDRDPAKRDDITAATTAAYRTLLLRDLAAVKTAEAAIQARVATDTKLMSLDPALIRKRVSGQPAAEGAKAVRRKLVRSIVYQASARMLTLADPAKIELLHRIVDRRLRIVERMLYDVGRADHRAWKSVAAAGPWIDSLERVFEYPRLPRSLFEGSCNPNDAQFGTCRAPMTGWRRPASADEVVGPNRAGPASSASWVQNPKDKYSFEYARPAATAPDSVTAIERIFTPSTDYSKRNLFYCDQVIHSLHLEALAFSETKRRAGGDHTWLEKEVKANKPGWLRLYYQFGTKPTDSFLAGDHEKSSWYFEQLQVRQDDLQVGDHLIVYNHPAYDHLTLHGVWRLENAVVVQTLPELKMQGHGSYVFTIGGAQRAMAGLFNDELERRRKDFEPLAAVRADGPNSVTVDSTARLRRGMLIDIVHGDTGAVLAGLRTITGIKASTVTYDGPDVKATAAHRLRRARTVDWGLETIDADGLTLRRRTPAAQSDYAGLHQRADWFVSWLAGDKEKEVHADPVRAAFVKEHQLVDYSEIPRPDGKGTSLFGWFPLWVPTLKGGQPNRVNGKIASTTPVVLGPRNLATWTWFFDADPAKRLMVPVIRPRAI